MRPMFVRQTMAVALLVARRIDPPPRAAGLRDPSPMLQRTSAIGFVGCPRKHPASLVDLGSVRWRETRNENKDDGSKCRQTSSDLHGVPLLSARPSAASLDNAFDHLAI